MKKFVIIFLCAVMLCLSACQPTPEKPPVISGNDDHLNEAINATPLPTDVVREDPDHKTDSFVCLDTNVTVNVDAEIVKPETNVFPVYRAEATPIADGLGRQIAEGVHPDIVFYQRQTAQSVEELEARLEEYRAFISDWNRLVKYYTDQGLTQEEAEETAAEVKEDYENNMIPELQRQIKEARDNPPSADPVPADYMLRPISYYIPAFSSEDQWRKMAFAYGMDANGTRITIQEEYSMDEIDHSVVQSTLRYDYGDKFKIPDPVWQPMTKPFDEAQELALSFVRNAGLSDFVLYRVTPRYIDDEGIPTFFSTKAEQKPIGYDFYFCKAINGVPIVKSGIVNEYARVQEDAHLTVVVTNEGVSFAFMKNSWKLGTVENENVSMLSFDEAYENFCRQAKVEYTLEGLKWEGAKKGTVEIRIKSIRLVYCAIQSVGGGYTVVPVWMFCGEMIVDGEPNTRANAYNADLFDANRFMIINAIDGSRISGVSGNGWGVDMY